MNDLQSGPVSVALRSTSRPTPGLAGTRLTAPGLLTTTEREAFEDSGLVLRPFKAGAELILEGEPADSLVILTEGWACRYKSTRDGRLQMSALLLAGDVANVDSLMFDALNYGVRTITAGTMLTLPLERVRELGISHPNVSRAFTWLALVENAMLTQWALCLGRQTSRERVAHLLCELAARLGHGDDEREAIYEMPLTQEQLGEALGLTAVHVNRMLKQLRKDGLLLSTSRSITIPDVAALREVGDFDPGYLHVHRLRMGVSSAAVL